MGANHIPEDDPATRVSRDHRLTVLANSQIPDWLPSLRQDLVFWSIRSITLAKHRRNIPMDDFAVSAGR